MKKIFRGQYVITKSSRAKLQITKVYKGYYTLPSLKEFFPQNSFVSSKPDECCKSPLTPNFMLRWSNSICSQVRQINYNTQQGCQAQPSMSLPCKDLKYDLSKLSEYASSEA